MIVKLLTEHHLEFLSSKRGCRCPMIPSLVSHSDLSIIFIGQQISIWNKQIESLICLIKQVGKCLKSDDQIRREHRKSRF